MRTKPIKKIKLCTGKVGFLHKNMKVQMKLIISFISLSVMLILIIGLFSYYKSSDSIKIKISTYSVQIANRISYEIRSL